METKNSHEGNFLKFQLCLDAQKATASSQPFLREYNDWLTRITFYFCRVVLLEDVPFISVVLSY